MVGSSGENHEKISLRFGIYGRLRDNKSRNRSIRSQRDRPGPPPPSDWGEQRPPPIDLDSAEPQQPSPYSTGSVGVTDPNAVGGECAKGFSEETCRRRGEKYNPPRSD